MTQAETLRRIKALGRHMTVRVRDGEYRVSFKIEAIQMVNDCGFIAARDRNETVAYYTYDSADAIATAECMHDQFVQSGRF